MSKEGTNAMDIISLFLNDIGNCIARIWAAVAHLFTRTLPAALVIWVASGRWQMGILVVGAGMMFQCLHSRTHHRQEWTAHPLFGVLGILVMAMGTISEYLEYTPRVGGWLNSLIVWMLVMGIYEWEMSWHRWQDREHLARTSRYADDRFPRYARHWAWLGLAIATMCVVATRLGVGMG